jgi:N-[(2S)-2-amino-2-carboxyethyl]-L-glutamate dehydrogenase
MQPALTSTATKETLLRLTSLRSPEFAVIPEGQVREVLVGSEPETVELVAQTYVAHGTGGTVNPPSYFLRFPEDPGSRIIALPAAVDHGGPVAGLKWIGSFPSNHDAGLPRASAVVILNDGRTGFPFACLEGALISAERTAASAALAARWLFDDLARPVRLACVGLGPIAQSVVRHLVATGWRFETLALFDLYPAAITRFAGTPGAQDIAGEIEHCESVEDAVAAGDLVIFATTAGTPHVTSAACFAHNPVVLHVSLRDLAPEITLQAANVVDDADHCLRANTSVHLAQQAAPARSVIAAELWEVMTGAVTLPNDRPRIFSPFGLGVLDLALACRVYEETKLAGRLTPVDGFFGSAMEHYTAIS